MYQRFDIIQFLVEYQKFPCLWKKSDPHFKDRLKRDAAESFLLQRFNFGTTKEMRQKIRSIRGTYNQERNKVRNSLRAGIGNIDVLYRPKLMWYDLADSFLRQNELENESDYSNLVNESDSNLEEGRRTEEEDCLFTETEKEEEPTRQKVEAEKEEESTFQKTETIKEEVVTSPEQPQLEPSTASLSSTHLYSTNLKRKREKGRLQNRRKIAKSDDSLDIAVNVLKEAASRLPSTNEFTVFGNLVASQLQTLPLAEALQLQADIQALITSARMQNLQNASSVMSDYCIDPTIKVKCVLISSGKENS
ncbi:uncharacterized protein [Halyomorpha halys]|uniref:uncharacterized protein isoform X2 n=1 Tax=Halyomorpha halys TaxID=286706 RepID=UPI0006D4D648|nr:uncharacterized protein LOC106682210 isoform X2 [Halyomorpha halys]